MAQQVNVARTRLDRSTIRFGGTAYLVAGADAPVDTDGGIASGFTATRPVLLGPLALALQKKKDNRGLFLMAEDPTA
jgi:hypothetical protein